MNKNEIEEIKQLIKDGFKIELIALELEIPIEQLKQYKEEVEKKKPKAVSTRKKFNTKSKMEQLRERYKKLYFQNNEEVPKKQKNLTAQQNELINSVIVDSEKIIKMMKELSKEEKRKLAFIMQKKIKTISDLPLTMEQSKRLYDLLQSEELKELRSYEKDKLESYIFINKRKMIKRLAEAIDIAQAQTNEIAELKKLQKNFTREMLQIQLIFAGAVNSKIESKIHRLQQQQAIERIKNDVPILVVSIADELTRGIADIKKMQAVIESEAKNRLENKTQRKFALTMEQEKEHILNQIMRTIVNRADKYKIHNPEETVLLIKELNGGNLELAVKTVVENLINNKEFDTAKNICDTFSIKSEYGKIAKYMSNLKRNVQNAEIGDLILKGIHMKSTEEEDRRYFEKIQKGLEIGNVKPKEIPLGKSQNGLKSIYLSDIWEPERRIK